MCASIYLCCMEYHSLGCAFLVKDLKTEELLYFWICGNKMFYDLFRSRDNITVTGVLLAKGVLYE